MKRWAYILLNFIYFLAVTGVVVKGHYCCNLTTLPVLEQVDNCCDSHENKPTCPMEHDHSQDQEDDGCCDGQTEIKKVDDWQAKTDLFQFAPSILTQNQLCFHCFLPQYLERKAEIPKYVIPQPRGIPLYKLHGDFRFYG